MDILDFILPILIVIVSFSIIFIGMSPSTEVKIERDHYKHVTKYIHDYVRKSTFLSGVFGGSAYGPNNSRYKRKGYKLYKEGKIQILLGETSYHLKENVFIPVLGVTQNGELIFKKVQ